MPDEEKTKIVNTCNRLREIGKEIAALTSESKELRAQLAVDADSQGLGTPTVEQPVEFLSGETLVSIKRSEFDNDFSITFKEMQSL